MWTRPSDLHHGHFSQQPDLFVIWLVVKQGASSEAGLYTKVMYFHISQRTVNMYP